MWISFDRFSTIIETVVLHFYLWCTHCIIPESLLDSFQGGMFKLNTEFDAKICYSTCSVILNATATQYTCLLNGVYCLHWLVQWSRFCSGICIPVHYPWLPGYVDVVQTILVILTMAGLFPDRPHVMLVVICVT